MKRLSVLFGAIVLAIGAIATSAFTTDSKPFVQTWFQFVGSDGNNTAQITNPANYSLITVAPSCPGVKDKICYIKVKSPNDVYQVAPNAGKPKVDVDEAGRLLRTKVLTAASTNTEFHDATLEIDIFLRQ